MSICLDAIAAEALAHSDARRVDLIDTYLGSVDAALALSPEAASEIQRLVDQADAGGTVFMSEEEALLRLSSFIQTRKPT